MCGDCTDHRARAELFNGAMPQILMSDPPYCSGGFQEAGRSAGSIGTEQKDPITGKATIKPTIANDTLSTRGFQALLKNMITGLPCMVAYLFTDWRMWIYLYDLVESSGFGVRSMLVWDKGSPGMGFGWRPQHELVIFSLKTSPQWDKHKGYGNVLKCKRSGNKLHPTQKPVELLMQLLDNTEWAHGVYDPFGGSGTTLVACEKKGQTCYAMELSPKFVDTIVRRYIVTTGRAQDVQLWRNGEKAPAAVFAPVLDDLERESKYNDK